MPHALIEVECPCCQALLKIDPETRRSQLVDPNTNFAAGDCLALEFSPNRDGHLYVFNLQSSGQWQVLLPSLQMPGEASLVKAEKTVRVPQEYCFRLDNPPGVETLLVVVTEREEDVDELQRAVLNSGDQRAAESHVSDDVDRWRKQQLGGRDIAVQALGREAARNEEPFSVYVVLTASEANTRIIVEVKIRHE